MKFRLVPALLAASLVSAGNHIAPNVEGTEIEQSVASSRTTTDLEEFITNHGWPRDPASSAFDASIAQVILLADWHRTTEEAARAVIPQIILPRDKVIYEYSLPPGRAGDRRVLAYGIPDGGNFRRSMEISAWQDDRHDWLSEIVRQGRGEAVAVDVSRAQKNQLLARYVQCIVLASALENEGMHEYESWMLHQASGIDDVAKLRPAFDASLDSLQSKSSSRNEYIRGMLLEEIRLAGDRRTIIFYGQEHLRDPTFLQALRSMNVPFALYTRGAIPGSPSYRYDTEMDLLFPIVSPWMVPGDKRYTGTFAGMRERLMKATAEIRCPVGPRELQLVSL